MSLGSWLSNKGKNLTHQGSLFGPDIAKAMGNKKSTDTTTTTSAPWSEAVPYWQDIFKNSAELAKNGPNTNTMAGWNMTSSLANNPTYTATLTGARDYANRVLSGEFLDPANNKAMAMQLQRGLESLGAFDSSAEAAGRYGSGAWGQMRGRNLADLQGNLYGQGLQQMSQMSALAPSIYKSQFLPAQTLTALGQEQAAYPWLQMQNQAGLLSAAGGGQSTTTQPFYQPGPLQQMLGLGSQGAGIYSMLAAL